MGTIRDGINGPFRGRVGSVIGSSWRKIHYIKGLPRRQKRGATEKQAVQRQKFKLLNEFLLPIASLLELGFAQHTGTSTGRNAAFSANFAHAFNENGAGIALNYPALQLSQGTLCPAGNEQAWLEADDLCVSWNPKTYGMGGSIDDTAHVLAYSPAELFFRSNDLSDMRQDGSARIKLGGLNQSEGLHVWLFFADRHRQQVSKSIYIPLSSTNA